MFVMNALHTAHKLNYNVPWSWIDTSIHLFLHPFLRARSCVNTEQNKNLHCLFESSHFPACMIKEFENSTEIKTKLHPVLITVSKQK